MMLHFCVLVVYVGIALALKSNKFRSSSSVRLEMPTVGQSRTLLADASDKLVFDEKSGRMFEQDMEIRLEDSFTLTDEETGATILLTKVVPLS